MAEIIFLSNKTRKESSKYFFVIVFGVITWILQVSIFSHFQCFDATANLFLLGCIYCGITFGPLMGILFGIISSFFIASILFDHTFYFSYPLFGLIAGLLTKNIFSDELLFYILISFLFTFPLEILNGWQYSFHNPINILSRYMQIGFYSAVLNLFLSPFFYYLMRFITKKLNLR